MRFVRTTGKVPGRVNRSVKGSARISNCENLFIASIQRVSKNSMLRALFSQERVSNIDDNREVDRDRRDAHVGSRITIPMIILT